MNLTGYNYLMVSRSILENKKIKNMKKFNYTKSDTNRNQDITLVKNNGNLHARWV